MSLAVSSLSKSYYNIYALTNSDTYKQNGVDSSAVSQAKYGVSDISDAYEMLSSESNFSTIGSVAGYAKDIYKLSQVKDSGTNEALSHSVVSLFSGDTDMTDLFSILDTSKANTEKVKASLGDSVSSSKAISAYSGTVAAYEQYLKNMNQSAVSLFI